MADDVDKSAEKVEASETEEVSAAADGQAPVEGGGAESAEAEGAAEAGEAEADAGDGTPAKSDETHAESDGEVAAPGDETVTDDVWADALKEAEGQEGEEAVTEDVWADALKESGDSDGSAAPQVVAESTEESKAIADAAKPADFSELTGSGTGALANMDMILDIPVTISVELGRSEMIIKEILQLGQGSVVELEKMAGEPMEILVNGKLVARGEVVMVNEKFGVRLTDIISPSERVKRLA